MMQTATCDTRARDRWQADTGRTYLCIDLKSFYASVECADRGLDPFTTNLVVADPTRGRGTICLAVTPAMKDLGVKNRCRLFQIPPQIRYITAPPRMRRYMQVSADIYGIYLSWFSSADIHVYSIDECFIDVTGYLGYYGCDARALARDVMADVQRQTHICATCGIGTNLFLTKVALDVTAKHVDDHIGFLDQQTFLASAQHHRPITDIWGIGVGIAGRLARLGAHDLAGVTRIDEAMLYREFGVNAGRLIDHAHGVEPCTIAQIRDFEPQGRSMCSGQVLPHALNYGEGLTVLRDMVDALVLDLVDRRLACGSVSLYVGYDNPGQVGRQGPHAAATRRLPARTGSRARLQERLCSLYGEVVGRAARVRRINIGFGGLVDERLADLTLFDDTEAEREEHQLMQTLNAVGRRWGKNALYRGRSLRPESTALERNQQVGGHRAD